MSIWSLLIRPCQTVSLCNTTAMSICFPLLPRPCRLFPSVTTTWSSVSLCYHGHVVCFPLLQTTWSSGSLCYHDHGLFPSVTEGNMTTWPSVTTAMSSVSLVTTAMSSVSLCYHEPVVCFPLLPRPCRLFPSVTTTSRLFPSVTTTWPSGNLWKQTTWSSVSLCYHGHGRLFPSVTTAMVVVTSGNR